MSFHEKLKQARVSARLTQQQVADALGITGSAYCGYETGKRQPDVQKIKMLSRILCISGDDLLETGFENKKMSAPENEGEHNFSNCNLVKVAGRDGSYEERYLTDEQLAALRAIISQLPDASDDL